MTRETSIALRVGVPVVAGVILLAAAWLLRRPDPPKPYVPEFGCVMPIAEPPVDEPVEIPPALRDSTPVPVAKPAPPPDIYMLAEECLKAPKWQTPEWGGPIKATAADIRYWVEVEHDPAWPETGGGSWWLPLSNEGVPDSPSGMYINVPIHGGSDCSGALVN